MAHHKSSFTGNIYIYVYYSPPCSTDTGYIVVLSNSYRYYLFDIHKAGFSIYYCSVYVCDMESYVQYVMLKNLFCAVFELCTCGVCLSVWPVYVICVGVVCVLCCKV